MSEILTNTANDISEGYDQQVKKVFANRPILPRILKGTVVDLMEHSLEVIEGYINL